MAVLAVRLVVIAVVAVVVLVRRVRDGVDERRHDRVRDRPCQNVAQLLVEGSRQLAAKVLVDARRDIHR